MTRTSNLGLPIMLFGMLILFGVIALVMLGQVQDLELPYPVPTVVFGLKPEHHGELNRIGIPTARYDELRREYEGDSVAQQQIDVYDPATEYHKRLREYVEAFKLSDGEKITELKDWFEEHYPDIHIGGK